MNLTQIIVYKHRDQQRFVCFFNTKAQCVQTCVIVKYFMTLCYCFFFQPCWPPKKLLARIFFFFKPNFLRHITLQVDDASFAVISFIVGDLLLCFPSIFCMVDNVAARIV